jgi:DNA-binding transcriptional LysR family regulator
MGWDDVRIFLAVARAGQLLGAARQLRLNHATVARRLDALEAALGAPLVHRQPHGSTLTPAGERFLPHAERMESAMLAAAASAGGGASLAGTVRIGAPDGFGVGFLAPRLGALAARHPGLVLELVPVPRAFSLSRREADIAITVEPPREGRLVRRKLCDYALGLYASRAYLARAGTPARPEDLAGHRLVGHVEDLIYAPSLDYARDIWRDWRNDLAISSALGQLEAVRAGAGIGILHRFLARAHAGLVPVLEAQAVTRSYWLVHHEDLRGLERLAAVARFVVAEVEAARPDFV